MNSLEAFMVDNWSGRPGRDFPGMRHYTITKSDTVDLAVRPRALYCQVAGDVVILDELGVQQTYTLSQGQIFPFSATRVLNTGTTATVIGWD